MVGSGALVDSASTLDQMDPRPRMDSGQVGLTRHRRVLARVGEVSEFGPGHAAIPGVSSVYIQYTCSYAK